MKEYVVQSGPLSITVIADCPRDAALEAVACWQGRSVAPARENRRAGLEPQMVVRRRGRRLTRCFSTIRMLAEVRRESVVETWKRLLLRSVGSAN